MIESTNDKVGGLQEPNFLAVRSQRYTITSKGITRLTNLAAMDPPQSPRSENTVYRIAPTAAKDSPFITSQRILSFSMCALYPIMI